MGFVSHFQAANSAPQENIVEKDSVEENIATMVTVVKNTAAKDIVRESIAGSTVRESIVESTIMMETEASIMMNIVEVVDTKGQIFTPVAFEIGLRNLVKVGD